MSTINTTDMYIITYDNIDGSQSVTTFWGEDYAMGCLKDIVFAHIKRVRVYIRDGKTSLCRLHEEATK